jgi:hypothetical protein
MDVDLLTFIDKKLDQILKDFGGPGSGFHGHKGRPGEVGGSTRDGSRANTQPSTATKGSSYLTRKKKEEFAKVIRKIFPHAELHASDPDEEGFAVQVNQNEEEELALTIYFEEEKGNRFGVGGESYTTGGEYFANTREIHMYDSGNVSADDMHSMLAHEVEHDRYEVFKQKVEHERNLIFVESKTTRKKIVDNDGNILKVSYEKKYPHYQFWQENILGRGSETFASLDGVSEYSKSYWTKANDGTGSFMEFESATNETLAEMNRINSGSYRTGDMTWKNIHPVWKNFYETVNNASE